MKNKYIIIIVVLFTLGFASSCKKDSEGLTKITYYPEFEYNETITMLPTGSSYTSSAVAKENGVEIPTVIETNADFSEAGLYEYFISATNSDGFTVTVSELVLVHNPAGNGTDVSGSIYDKASPGRTGEIYLVDGTSNLYYCTDMGGSGVLPVYFEMNGDVMRIIQQPWNYAAVAGATGTYDPIAMEFDITFSTGWNYVFAYVTK